MNQIKKNSKDIQVFLTEIESVDLYRIPVPNADGSLLQCKEFFEYVESKRKNDLTELSKKYKLIGPLVTKLEGLVFGTNTSRSGKMASYYAFWEKEIYTTITKMIKNNLRHFNDSLCNVAESSGDHLFQLETILAVPDIALYLSPNEMGKLFVQSVRDCIESANYFTRWMNGTCKECAPVKSADAGQTDEVFLYTFYQDVAQRPEIRELAAHIQANMQKTVQLMRKYLLKFKKYKSLWKADKALVCEKFAAKNQSVVAYDEKLLYYSKIIEEVATLPKYKNIDFIKLSMRSLCESISMHAKEWMKCLGQQLNESAKRILYELKAKFDVSTSNKIFAHFYFYFYIN